MKIKRINSANIFAKENKLQIKIEGVSIDEKPFKIGFKTKESDSLEVKLIDISFGLNEFLKMVK